MTRLTWSNLYPYTGVDRGVFYQFNGIGTVWPGISNITETVEDSSVTFKYCDGQRIRIEQLGKPFSGSINCWELPDNFYDNFGDRRRADMYSFSYRVVEDDSVKLHLVYNAISTPSKFTYSAAYSSININFTTRPMHSPEGQWTSHVVIDQESTYPDVYAHIEDILYGSGTNDPRMPSIEELYALYEEHALLRVIDNGDGSASITGPDTAVVALDSTSYSITWPTVRQQSSDTYSISSL